MVMTVVTKYIVMGKGKITCKVVVVYIIRDEMIPNSNPNPNPNQNPNPKCISNLIVISPTVTKLY